MSFADQLAELNRNTCENISAPQMAILQRAIVTLRKSGIQDRRLQSGESCPNFEFINKQGEPETLCHFLQKGPVILNFFRGFWCSFCKAELEAFESALSDLESLGVQYLAICPQETDASDTDHKNFHVVSDADNQIAKSFGIVYELDEQQKQLFDEWQTDLKTINRSDRWELPLPATYLIDSNRKVRFSFVDVDFRKRMDPQEIVDFVREHLT